MASHWPVIVGINQYQSLQPLLFAQFDAIELKDFLVGEAGLPPQQCSLLTDISPMVYQGAAFPTREVILQRLQQSCERATPEDTVWFFFSGYGVHWQGQDYLVPIDGNPSQITQTGIALQAIFDLLQGSPARQRLVVLDMNRSQSALTNQRLGVPTMELARQLDIPLLMSCRPNQFSQETLAVRHGLFTEALLEGLRFHGCLTLSQMAAYLNDRVPELCQHHFRPEQNPVAVISPHQQFLMLVPPRGVGQMAMADLPGTAAVAAAPGDFSTAEPAGAMPYGKITSLQERPPVVPAPPDIPKSSQAGEFIPDPDGGMASAVEVTAVNPEPATRAGWQWWLLVAAGMLLLGVLLRNQATFLAPRQANQEGNSVAESEEAVETTTSAPAAPAPGNGTEAPAEDSPAAEAPGAEPLFPTTTGSTPVDPQVALERARVALEQQQFGEALNWLNQVPEDQRPEDFATLQQQAQTGYDNATQSGDEVLNSARQIIEPLPASLFNDAIEAARQVPVGDTYYDQAQADIARWSRVILDLAQGRAAAGNFAAAIAAANLVPQDQGEVYAQAQANIQQWQQQQVNRQILQDAQSRPLPDQATSFEEAIKLAQQIPPGTPEYEVAQERINQWSEDILVIARARAAVGQVPGAIAAAELVPAGTSAYDQAQAEIQRWQQGQ